MTSAWLLTMNRTPAVDYSSAVAGFSGFRALTDFAFLPPDFTGGKLGDFGCELAGAAGGETVCGTDNVGSAFGNELRVPRCAGG